MEIYTAIDLAANDLSIAQNTLALLASDLAEAVIDRKEYEEIAKEYIRIQGKIEGISQVYSYLLGIDTGVSEGDFVRHIADMVEELLESIRSIEAIEDHEDDKNKMKETKYVGKDV